MAGTVQPARSAMARIKVESDAVGEQQLGEMGAQPFALGRGGALLVDVAVRGGRGELLHEDEDRLGERGHRGGIEAERDAGLRDVAPGHPGAGPVGRHQRGQRAALAPLEPADLLERLDASARSSTGDGARSSSGSRSAILTSRSSAISAIRRLSSGSCRDEFRVVRPLVAEQFDDLVDHLWQLGGQHGQQRAQPDRPSARASVIGRHLCISMTKLVRDDYAKMCRSGGLLTREDAVMDRNGHGESASRPCG